MEGKEEERKRNGKGKGREGKERLGEGEGVKGKERGRDLPD